MWFMIGDTVGLLTLLFWQGLCSLNKDEPVRPVTRFDKITQSPEELAKVLSDVYVCKYCAYIESCKLEGANNCKTGINEYLNQKVEGCNE
jgi:hypothetical protein